MPDGDDDDEHVSPSLLARALRDATADLDRLHAALTEAVQELERHNADYHFITPIKQIEAWRMLLLETRRR